MNRQSIMNLQKILLLIKTHPFLMYNNPKYVRNVSFKTENILFYIRILFNRLHQRYTEYQQFDIQMYIL